MINVVECDLNDSRSIQAAVDLVLNQVPADKEVKLVTNLPLSLKLHRYQDGKVDIVVGDNWEYSQISTSEDYGEGRKHRWLSFPKETVMPLSGGLVAHELFKFVAAVETVLYGEFCKEESVSGLDLVLFWIREGYMPEKRLSYNNSGENVEKEEMLPKLTDELVNYLKPKMDKRLNQKTKHSNYDTRLVYNPQAAALYWEELKRISGYRERG